jgi:excinuclease UvrABC nuclease subunit
VADPLRFDFEALPTEGLGQEEMPTAAPARRAVFRIFDPNGKLILLEKTHNLRTRLRRFYAQEPQPGAVDLRRIGKRIEYCRTDSPFESLYVLYLERRQWFPSRYRRMRTFPLYLLLEVDAAVRFPRITVARNVREGVRAFGPFRGRRAAGEARAAMERLFRLRPCDYDIRGDDPYPDCLYFQMETCSRPCNGDIDRERYLEDVGASIAWLLGEEARYRPKLLERIRALADEMRFEEAEQLRVQLEGRDPTSRSGRDQIFDLDHFHYVVLMKAASVKRRKIAVIRGGAVVAMEEHPVAEIADTLTQSLTGIREEAVGPARDGFTYDEFCLAASFLNRRLPSVRFFPFREPQETAEEIAEALQPSGDTAGASSPVSPSAPGSEKDSSG